MFPILRQDSPVPVSSGTGASKASPRPESSAKASPRPEPAAKASPRPEPAVIKTEPGLDEPGTSTASAAASTGEDPLQLTLTAGLQQQTPYEQPGTSSQAEENSQNERYTLPFFSFNRYSSRKFVQVNLYLLITCEIHVNHLLALCLESERPIVITISVCLVCLSCLSVCLSVGLSSTIYFLDKSFSLDRPVVFKLKGTHTVYFSSSFYIINPKPMILTTDFHFITTWVAHSSG